MSDNMRSESKTWSSERPDMEIGRVVPEDLAVAVVPGIEPLIVL